MRNTSKILSIVSCTGGTLSSKKGLDPNSYHLESRFAPTYYDDPKGALFKPTQTSSVNDYLTEFERLANRIFGLPPPFLLSCFVSGLAPEICREVLALQPISLPQATALAKLQEDKLRDRPQPTRQPILTSYKPSTHPSTFPSPSPSPRPKPPFIQRTPSEIAFRRKHGLCYNCDDKWSATHRCKGRVLLFIANPENPDTPSDLSSPPAFDSHPPPEHNPTPNLDLPYPTPHISLNALFSLPTPETFRLFGYINRTRVTVLIDSGSTHNFLQPRLANFLHLPTVPIAPLRVLVGNGAILTCTHLCPDTTLSPQSHQFTLTFHLLPISGADIILGI